MTILGGWRTGVSWDETYHVFRLSNYHSVGWYLLDRDLVSGEPHDRVRDAFVYAPVTAILLTSLTDLVGVSPGTSVPMTATAFAWRHLGVALLGVTTLAAVATATWRILQSWKWSTIAAACLVAIPMWTGHSMFNIKDIPVAAGFTLVTLGLVLLATLNRGGRLTGLVIGIVMLVGWLLAVGTRPGIWPGLAVSVAFLGGWLILQRQWRHLGLLLAPMVLGVGALYLVYPAPFETPWIFAVESVSGSADYRGGGGSALYVPAYALVQVPLPILVSAVVGIGSTVAGVARQGLRLEGRQVATLIVMSQALVIPVLATARGSQFYNGLRQLLFICPAVAILAVIGLAWLTNRSQAFRGWPMWAATCLALVSPMVDQVRLFPYNYTYFNLTADVADINGESDYWRTAVRELAPHIPAAGLVVCTPLVGHAGALRYSFDGNENCLDDRTGPLQPYLTHLEVKPAEPLAPDEFYVVMTRTEIVPANCERPFGEVSRPRHHVRVTMAYVAKCALPFPRVGEDLDFTSSTSAYAALIRGWDTAGESASGLRITGAEAELGLNIGPDGDVRRLALYTSVEPEVVALEGASILHQSWDNSSGLARITVQPNSDRDVVLRFRDPDGSFELRQIGLGQR